MHALLESRSFGRKKVDFVSDQDVLFFIKDKTDEALQIVPIAQNLIRDFISAFFILLENQYRVGDVIRAAGVSGQVEDMNLRITVLGDLEGVAHFIASGEIKVVSNLAKEWSRAIVNVGVA